MARPKRYQVSKPSLWREKWLCACTTTIRNKPGALEAKRFWFKSHAIATYWLPIFKFPRGEHVLTKMRCIIAFPSMIVMLGMLASLLPTAHSYSDDEYVGLCKYMRCHHQDKCSRCKFIDGVPKCINSKSDPKKIFCTGTNYPFWHHPVCASDGKTYGWVQMASSWSRHDLSDRNHQLTIKIPSLKSLGQTKAIRPIWLNIVAIRTYR